METTPYQSLEGYSHLELVAQSKRAIIFSAVRSLDGQPVILKKIRSPQPSPQEIASFKREYALICQISNEGVIKALDFFTEGGSWYIALEGIKGISLRNLIHEQSLSLDRFFSLALPITKALAAIHSAGIIHKDIKPANILVLKDDSIKVIDFSIAAEVSQNTSNILAEILEGTLEYISPEQTGRVNRPVQYSSDLYSLGMTFYAMLTGHPPFISDKASELIYAHLSKLPPLLTSLRPQIPQVISAIIAKLVSKAPEDRYQTAHGLFYDLEKCALEWSKSHAIAWFSLGQLDIPEHLKISSKLYGREHQIQQLLQTTDEIHEQAQLIFIKGYAGVGKTSLIKEIEPTIYSRKGILIDGKFDQLSRHVPYYALKYGLQKFIKSLLLESPGNLSSLKNSLNEALGSQGQVIIDLVPELELIIGKQPPIPYLPISDSQNRFRSVLSRLLQALATKERPLIICLDDLQWADLASLNAIQTIIPNVKYCLFLGLYRSNEVNRLHPLTYMLEKLNEEGVPVQEMDLLPLSYADTEAYLKDIFASDHVKDLCKLVYKKTEGNPFFCKEFIRYLGENKLFYYQRDKKEWFFNLPEIEKLKISPNVVDLMRDKMNTLKPETRELLGIASALGVEFRLSVLSDVMNNDPSLVIELLEPALRMELLSSSEVVERGESIDVVYQFCHDKNQQAAYELIPKDNLPYIHLTIAKKAVDLPINELIYHYNQALPLLKDRGEIRHVIDWNLVVAKKSKEATAYQSSLENLLAAETLTLKQYSWETQKELFFELYTELAECYFLLYQFDKAENIFQMLLDHADQKRLKAPIYCLKAKLYLHLDRLGDCLDAGKKGLALFGIAFPDKVKDRHLLMKILKIRFLELWHNPANLKPIKNKDAILASDLLTACFLAAFQTDPRLFILMCAESAAINLKYGYTTSLKGLFILSYLFVFLKDFKRAFKYNQAVHKLNEKLGQAVDWGDILVISGAFIDHWFGPYSNNLSSLVDGGILARENGSLFYASSAELFITALKFRMGTPLKILESLSQENIESFSKMHRSGFLELTILVKEVYSCLNGSGDLNEALVHKNLEALIKQNNEALLQSCYGSLSYTYFMLENYETALKYAKIAFKMREANLCNIIGAHHDLTIFLTMAKQNHYTHEMRVIENDMKCWAKQSPANYFGFYHLILGEKQRIFGDLKEAIKCYENAEINFRKGNWPHYIGLVAEYIANAYTDLKKPTLASFYRREAFYSYKVWECFAKTKLMELNYPEFLMPLTGEKTSESTNTSTSNIIDYLSLVKATQAISEEIVIENLLKRVMHVILENTGAQHGVILIEKGGKLFIHAEGVQKENQISTLFLNEPFSKTSKLPYSLIYYVGKTQEQVLANSPKSPFFKDAYFTGKEVKAALCLPIKQHGTNVGILYLEHFLNIYAFNVNNLKAINLILAQVSISFENARLYASYGRFVPKEFLQNLNRSNINEISLGDRIERNMTVLFADMSEFITLTKDLTDDEIFDFINEFLSRCSPIIYKHGGFVDKYIGDAIMGLFTTEPDNALLAAKEIAQSILEWNSSPHRIDIPPINIEIGINTGPLILGVIGEAERLESSVLGDTVNIASRIQAINKMYNSTILISGETKAKLAQPENYQMEFLESVQLRGKQKLIEIWKLGTVQS